MTTARPVTNYHITAGPYKASNHVKDNEQSLLYLRVERGMDTPGGACWVELGNTQSTLLKLGEAVKVELDTGAGPVCVFSGEVADLMTNPTTVSFQANDSLSKIQNTEWGQVYQDVTADFILKDLLQKTGAIPGDIGKGPKFPSYVAHQGRAALHLRSLVALSGAEVYSDGEGKVHIVKADKKGKEHQLSYGENVLHVKLKAQLPAYDSVEAWGEGAASSQGAEKSHWLCTDLSGTHGKASIDSEGKVLTDKLGKRPMTMLNGALRSGEVAKEVSQSCMSLLATRGVIGHVDIFGNPSIQPNDQVKLDKVPAEHPLAKFLAKSPGLRVRNVSHFLDKQRGFISRLSF